MNNHGFGVIKDKTHYLADRHFGVCLGWVQVTVGRWMVEVMYGSKFADDGTLMWGHWHMLGQQVPSKFWAEVEANRR